MIARSPLIGVAEIRHLLRRATHLCTLARDLPSGLVRPDGITNASAEVLPAGRSVDRSGVPLPLVGVRHERCPPTAPSQQSDTSGEEKTGGVRRNARYDDEAGKGKNPTPLGMHGFGGDTRRREPPSDTKTRHRVVPVKQSVPSGARVWATPGVVVTSYQVDARSQIDGLDHVVLASEDYSRRLHTSSRRDSAMRAHLLRK